MKKSLIPSAAISLVALVLVAVLLAVNTGVFAARASNDVKIHVIEHAITDTVGDVPPKGDSLGDVLAFHNPVFDPADKQQVGHDNGHCIRTVVGKEWECFWTVFLAAGQITVEGPFLDNGKDTTLAITGGTGTYKEAHGQMILHDHFGNGTEFDFFYEVVL